MQYLPPGENYPQYPPVTYPPGGPYPPPPHGGYPPGPYPGPTYPPPVPQYAIPVAAPGCPPGLEYLLPLDQVIVKQKKELLELMTDIETANTYVCLNVRNEIIYKCTEESNFCARQCLRAQRPFYMHLFDPAGHEVIRVHRPYKCYCCWECCTCSSCCQDEVEIQAPVGVTAGYVKQICSGMSITYDILNADRQVELKICGPCYCYCKCFGEDIDFPIKSRDESVEIGKISKKWTGIVQEWFTDADTFGVSFKLDLDVRMKAVLIGAVFLIDFMFFEENQPKKELDGHL